jgi:hypothetical protein
MVLLPDSVLDPVSELSIPASFPAAASCEWLNHVRCMAYICKSLNTEMLFICEQVVA